MISALICDKGFEKIVAKDLATKFDIHSNIKETYLIFESDPKKLISLCYTCQSAIKVLGNVVEFSVGKDLSEIDFKKISEEINMEISKFDYKFSNIKISCVRNGDHNFRSVDVSSFFSSLVMPNTNKCFKNQDFEILVYINGTKGIIGVDYSGRNLAKRDYKIFIGANTLRATIAYNLLCFAEVKKSDCILDPFMGSGIIPIEAALSFSKTSPFFFSKEKFLFRKFLNIDCGALLNEVDSNRDLSETGIMGYDSLLKFLSHAQKNAKIADVNKLLKLSKVEIDWIDTKISPDTIDKIVTHPPIITENGSKSKILRIYKDFFLRVKDLLSKDGKIIILTTPSSSKFIVEIAKDFDFKLDEELKIYEGMQELSSLRFIT